MLSIMTTKRVSVRMSRTVYSKMVLSTMSLIMNISMSQYE